MIDRAAIFGELETSEWAMEPESLKAFARMAASVDPIKASQVPSDMPARQPYRMEGRTAVVAITGTLLRKVPSWAKYLSLDVTETGSIRTAIEDAVKNPGVDSIMLHVDSPGGQAAGVLDVAQSIRAARSAKPIFAQVENMAASGGYWLASQADEITAPPDAKVGSIGVYTVAIDASAAAEAQGVKVHVVRSGAHKGAGEIGAPITAEHLDAMQSLVNGIAGLFVGDVAAGRRKPVDQIKPHATGRVWLAAEAKANGLIDHVEPVGRMSARMTKERVTMSAEKTNDAELAAAQAKAAIETERARVKAIRAEFAEDRAFADAQCDAGATLEQAKLAYLPVMREKLAKANQAAEDAAKKPAPAAPVPSVGAPALPRGADPTLAAGRGFLEVAKERAAEKKLSIVTAMQQIAREEPELHARFKAEAQAKAPEHNAKKRALGIG